MTYRTGQDEFIKATKIFVGDFLSINEKSPGRKNGWDADWVEEMDECVGHIGKITQISPIHGFQLDTSFALPHKILYWFPYFVLAEPDLSRLWQNAVGGFPFLSVERYSFKEKKIIVAIIKTYRFSTNEIFQVIRAFVKQ